MCTMEAGCTPFAVRKHLLRSCATDDDRPGMLARVASFMELMAINVNNCFVGQLRRNVKELVGF